MKCNICGVEFDPAELSKVAYHEHAGIDIKQNFASIQLIRHASEIYPNCSREFACGVHSYLRGNGYPVYNESNEFKRGYWQADSDELIDKVKKI